MNHIIAKILYWNSVLADQSEMPKAAIREIERRKLLQKRLGDEVYKKWEDQHKWD